MDNLKLNHAKSEINFLTKQLDQWKRDYGELLLSNGEIQRQLADLTHERQDLHHQLAVANDTPLLLKRQHEGQIRDFESQIQMLKKENQHLSVENRDLEANKVKCEEELWVLRGKIAKLEEEKVQIMKKEKDEVSRVSKKNDKLTRELSAVVDVAGDKFRALENRLSKVEQEVVVLTHNSFPSGSHLVDTPQVMQEQESFGPEAKSDGFVGAQSGYETTPIIEKTASSMPGPKGRTATSVKGRPQSFESEPFGVEEKSTTSMPRNRKFSSAHAIELSSSDDEGKQPSPKGLKRKLHSSDTSYKMRDGGSSSGCRLKDQIDLTHEASYPLKKTVHKWDFEADLLDDLQKDNELCLKGICALHRQHMLLTIRETSLARSLIGGATLPANIDPDECRRIALAHSRHLFDIYKTGKDPLFSHENIFC